MGERARLTDRYVHELAIRLAPAETGVAPARPDRLVATLLVDGLDLLDDVEPRGWVGFPADDQVVATSPLLPGPEPRWVGLARCNCGDAGCGTLAAVVRRQGSTISWSDVRRFVGVFDGPLSTLEIHTMEGDRAGLPDVIRFEAAQYEAAVREAAGHHRRGTSATRG